MDARIKAAAAVLAVLATTPAWAAGKHRGGEWETAWATAPAAAVSGTDQGYAGYTIRNVVHPTAGGDRVRIHLSNRFGTAPVFFGHVTVAVAAAHPSDGTAAGLPSDVLFDGRTEFTVPAGADAISDPVALRVPQGSDLLVSMPFEGWRTWTPAMEAVRLAVNDWIRRSFPAVADFDAATRDPADPARIAPAYDSGDHLHPNDAGDLAMANVVPLGAL